MKKVIGIGNALTDILVTLDNDTVLSHFNLAKGSMSLVDSQIQNTISGKTAGLPRAMSLGGSAGNTIRALAKLGQQTGFIGKVGRDETGDFFEAALGNLGIESKILRGTKNSGVCISLVSGDGERTMATHLGAALEMNPEELADDLLEGYDCLYIEGYLVQNHALIREAAAQAKRRGLKVAIDLASFNVVEENRDFLHELARKYVDIIFANEQEAEAFTGHKDPKRGADEIARICDLAIVKIGNKGAYIKENSVITHVGIMSEANRVDTTGAGDFYAAGFLSGMCDGLSLRQCGTIGSITAGKVIEVVGTTFADDIWDEVARLVDDVRREQYLF